ncbi:hypothetical protein [Hydrogenivirga sp. 128-5-R1-1]|uniref:hypothetical protein n=1 Tax=Hydrogenivirga sp. 128-5-R1-1 TaxID=392423 RepID=UPI00015F2F39|nr:hypothetical protein [Hydrogenivirga sp. 128-5-R1-1]EDP73420.1 hypothetical protein HG1285_07073 [Hydrogenivirga sp. 128-5-R1-1]
MKFCKWIFLLLIFANSFSFSETKSILESQIYNLRIYSLKALNLSLKAYSSLNAKRKSLNEIKVYLKSALFFLNEASNYSPSYLINKKIDTILLRIELFRNENIKKDLISLRNDIKDIRGNIANYEKIETVLDNYIKNYSPEKNEDLLLYLSDLKSNITLPLIDTPLENAKTFIAIAYDNVNSRNYLTAKKSVEIAIDPLIDITSRENLYLVLFKNYIYKSFESLKKDDLGEEEKYLEIARKYLLKAKEVSKPSNINLINNLLERLELIYNTEIDDKEDILKEYLILIENLKNF